MFYSIYKTWRPWVFQGRMKKDRYFEGWYYKNVDAAGDRAFALIAGISLSGKDSHSFIQFFDAADQKAHYFRYPPESFQADSKTFDVIVGNSRFTGNSIFLDASHTDISVKADLNFTGIHPWPVSLFSPGVMGWYAFVPSMECYHGVLSFNHHIRGHIEIDGTRHDFTGGKGYLEKDWGTSMPSSWIWMQTNHFPDPEVSLFLSIAKIPWHGSYFNGHIAGLFYHGKVHRFATYTGAALRHLIVSDKEIELCIEDKTMGLRVTGHREAGVELPAPKLGEMTARVNESLKSTIDIIFYRKGSDVMYQGSGTHAGLECVGDMDELAGGR